MLILIGLLFILPMLGAQFGADLSIVSRVIASSTDAIIGAILRLTIHDGMQWLLDSATKFAPLYSVFCRPMRDQPKRVTSPV
jgi:hypothetical protein